MTEGLSGSFQPVVEDAFRSPGLSAEKEAGPAFELKFLLTNAEAEPVEAWVRQRLLPDPHGEDGKYRITSVYCDTPGLDVFHRSPGYRRSKYRVRCYDSAPCIFLERKKRRGNRVKKKRAAVPAEELGHLTGASSPVDWAGAWFLRRLTQRQLFPVCRVAYDRTAFFGRNAGPAIRLTLDRNLAGASACGWDVLLKEGAPLLPDGVLLEMKFHAAMPEVFRELLPQLPIQQTRLSKYRRCVQVCGLIPPASNPPARPST